MDVNLESLSVGLLIIMFLWGEGMCLLSRYFIKSTVLELGFSGMTKKKLNKLLLKHSLLDELFLLGLRRDAKASRDEITYWCVINGLCVFLALMIPFVTMIGYYFPKATWLSHLLYELPLVFMGFVIITTPVSNKSVRKKTTLRSLAIQGLAVVTVLVFAIVKIISKAAYQSGLVVGKNNEAWGFALCAMGLLACALEYLVVRSLNSKTRELIENPPGKSKEIREILQKPRKLLRAYQVEQVMMLVGTGLCVVLLVMQLILGPMPWIGVAAIAITAVCVVTLIVTQIAALDNTIRPKTRQEALVETIVFIVLLVLVALYKV